MEGGLSRERKLGAKLRFAGVAIVGLGVGAVFGMWMTGRRDVPSIGAPDRMTEVMIGLLDFTRPKDLVGGGLGPYYNALNCSTCHFVGGTGGMGDLETAVRRVVHPDAEKWPGGPFLHRYQLDGFSPKAVPTGARTEARVGPPLFGIGEFEGVGDAEIESLADPDDANGDGISGRIARVDGGVGRFGVKGVDVTLKAFVRRAASNELGALSDPHTAPRSTPDTDGDGVPEPEISEGGLKVIVAFIRALPVPLRRKPDKPGADLFVEVGCDRCHVPELNTPGGMIAPYSDLLLHDLGEELADGIQEGAASGGEFRTAPLWGIPLRRVFLHDGRAKTIPEAILLHGGEGHTSRLRFSRLGQDQQKVLVDYLGELYDDSLQRKIYAIDPEVERKAATDGVKGASPSGK